MGSIGPPAERTGPTNLGATLRGSAPETTLQQHNPLHRTDQFNRRHDALEACPDQLDIERLVVIDPDRYALEHMFVLGIDPGLSTTGYGLVEDGHPPRAVMAGVIRTDPAGESAERLAVLYDALTRVIDENKPQVVAVEMVFTNRNLQTAISVGRASGVVLLAAARAGVPVFEYVPTAVKSAVTGDGSANKTQVQTMVARLLSLAHPPKPADAADALAIALCHLRVAPLIAGQAKVSR